MLSHMSAFLNMFLLLRLAPVLPLLLNLRWRSFELGVTSAVLMVSMSVVSIYVKIKSSLKIGVLIDLVEAVLVRASL